MNLRRRLKKELPLHLMMIPGLIIIAIFSYMPMAGLIIAFQRFIPAKGMFGDQQWIGLGNFRYLFKLPNFRTVVWNTVYIAGFKIILGLIVPIIVSLLLNEMRSRRLKKYVQTAIYLPHFLSWVVLGGIFIDILSPGDGIVNQLIVAMGGKPIFFLGSNDWFPFTLIITETWKSFGYGTIVYLAAITSIDPTLYEAARVDGAGRFRRIWHVTLPGMMNVIVLMALLNIGNILNAGFDQVFNMYSAPVYQSGDIIDTFVYRIGMLDAQFGVATAVGLFKSVISMFFLSLSYWLAYKIADYRIF